MDSYRMLACERAQCFRQERRQGWGGGGAPFPSEHLPIGQSRASLCGGGGNPSLPLFCGAGSLRLDGPHWFIVAASSVPNGDVGGYLGK